MSFGRLVGILERKGILTHAESLAAMDGEVTAFWFEENRRPASYKFVCSACGGLAFYPTGKNGNSKAKKACGYKYCPNCGIAMINKEAQHGTT